MEKSIARVAANTVGTAENRHQVINLKQSIPQTGITKSVPIAMICSISVRSAGMNAPKSNFIKSMTIGIAKIVCRNTSHS